MGRTTEALQRRAERKAARVHEKNISTKDTRQNWICTEPGCGNDNFARRVVCNLCGAQCPMASVTELPKKKKNPRPLKTSWKKNPTPEQIEENIRLRNLLEVEKSTGAPSGLTGEDLSRAEFLYAKLARNRHRKLIVLEKKIRKSKQKGESIETKLGRGYSKTDKNEEPEKKHKKKKKDKKAEDEDEDGGIVEDSSALDEPEKKHKKKRKIE